MPKVRRKRGGKKHKKKGQADATDAPGEEETLTIASSSASTPLPTVAASGQCREDAAMQSSPTPPVADPSSDGAAPTLFTSPRIISPMRPRRVPQPASNVPRSSPAFVFGSGQGQPFSVGERIPQVAMGPATADALVKFEFKAPKGSIHSPNFTYVPSATLHPDLAPPFDPRFFAMEAAQTKEALERARADAESRIAERDARLAEAEREKEELRRRLGESERAGEQLRTEMRNKMDENRDVVFQLGEREERLQRDMEKREAQNKARQEELAREVREMEQQVRSVEYELDMRQRELEKTQSDLARVQADLKDKVKELEEAKHGQDNARQMLSDIRVMLEEKMEQLQDAKIKIRQLEDEIRELALLKEKNEQLAEANAFNEKQLEQGQEQLDLLSQELDELRTERDTNREDIDGIRKRNEALTQENNLLLDQVEKLQNSLQLAAQQKEAPRSPRRERMVSSGLPISPFAASLASEAPQSLLDELQDLGEDENLGDSYEEIEDGELLDFSGVHQIDIKPIPSKVAPPPKLSVSKTSNTLDITPLEPARPPEYSTRDMQTESTAQKLSTHILPASIDISPIAPARIEAKIPFTLSLTHRTVADVHPAPIDRAAKFAVEVKVPAPPPPRWLGLEPQVWLLYLVTLAPVLVVGWIWWSCVREYNAFNQPAWDGAGTVVGGYREALFPGPFGGLGLPLGWGGGVVSEIMLAVEDLIGVDRAVLF